MLHKPYVVLKVINFLVISVYCVTEYTVCSFIVLTAQYTNMIKLLMSPQNANSQFWNIYDNTIDIIFLRFKERGSTLK
jgi:capsular polysaccharide biosynthesis protein